MNKYFDKIFVINLFDKTERWEKVRRQFKNRKIDVERFIAVDGRCKKEGDKACLAKLNSFEMAYDIKILNKSNYPLRELLPASSLTIGTIILLRAMVKNEWKRMLICEDDVVLSRGLENNFKKGIKDVKNRKWDVLYLGCGNQCGVNGISYDESRKTPHQSTLNQFTGDELYVKHKFDLRGNCKKCKPVTELISVPVKPGGTWCYAYSLEGAKKILKILEKDAGQHIDHIVGNLIRKKKASALAFDPPIVWHEEGAIRSDSDIPWEW